MGGLNNAQQAYLKGKFGYRATFDIRERKLYGNDIAAMPGLFRPLIGNTIPDAVVHPENEAELIELVRWASANRIPLTPRGKATPKM
ncbi:MAG TPA: FAD-binding protein [bacterium]